MNNKRYSPILMAIAALMLVLAACATAGGQPAAPTDTSAPPTNTPRPTATPKPTATPDVAATQAYSEVMADVKDFYDKGYLPSTNGKLYTLEDYANEMAKINYITFDLTGYEDRVRDFVVWADLAWESAGPVNYPEYSGCGFAYRYQDNGDGYTALIANDSIWMGYCDQSIRRCGRLGTTSGTGKLSLGNPAKASMTMAVNESHAYVMVDDNFIGEYTLFTEKLLDPGYLLYSLISGTNRDYGTRCEVTNSQLWVVKP